MPRDNEELGRFLEALSRNKLNRLDREKRRLSHIVKRFGGRIARLKDFIDLIYMLALLWGAHWLMRSATRLFLNGFVSVSKTRTLLRWAAGLNRASLVVLRRSQRRRLVGRYAGNDNNDRRA